MSTIIKRTEYTPLDPGIYPAQVQEVELADGQYGQQVKVKFQIDDDEEQGLEDRFLIGWASASFGPKASCGHGHACCCSAAARYRMSSGKSTLTRSKGGAVCCQ